MKLFADTAPSNNSLIAGTVPTNNSLLVETVISRSRGVTVRKYINTSLFERGEGRRELYSEVRGGHDLYEQAFQIGKS